MISTPWWITILGFLRKYTESFGRKPLESQISSFQETRFFILKYETVKYVLLAVCLKRNKRRGFSVGGPIGLWMKTVNMSRWHIIRWSLGTKMMKRGFLSRLYTTFVRYLFLHADVVVFSRLLDWHTYDNQRCAVVVDWHLLLLPIGIENRSTITFCLHPITPSLFGNNVFLTLRPQNNPPTTAHVVTVHQVHILFMCAIG